MARKFYTIFILPHATARFRKIHVSKNFLITAVAAAAMVFVLGVVSPHVLLKARAQASDLARLEAENLRLREDNARFEASLARIGDQVNTIETVAGKLAGALGLKDLPLIRPAGGGMSPQETELARELLLEQEIGALEKRASALDRSFERISAAWEDRLRLLASTPSLMPVDGPLSDGFGWRADPFTGQREFHEGLDIVAPLGTPVRAAADGLVTGAGRMSGYGNAVHLTHGYGLATRYGHMSKVFVRPGQRVRKGDTIGAVGSTGRSTGPHLHFEVYRSGRPVNPRPFVKGEAS